MNTITIFRSVKSKEYSFEVAFKVNGCETILDLKKDLESMYPEAGANYEDEIEWSCEYVSEEAQVEWVGDFKFLVHPKNAHKVILKLEEIFSQKMKGLFWSMKRQQMEKVFQMIDKPFDKQWVIKLDS